MLQFCSDVDIIEYNLVPTPGRADPHRETELDILQSQPWSAALSFWFVFLFLRNIFNIPGYPPQEPRLSDLWSQWECRGLQISGETQSANSHSTDPLHPVLTSTPRWRTSVNLLPTSRRSFRTRPSRLWVRRTRRWRGMTAVRSLTGGGERTTFSKIRGGESRKISERKAKFNYMFQLWCIRLF